MRRNTKLYLVAAIASLILYFAGVLSGMYATRVVKHQTGQEIRLMQDYVNSVKMNLEDIQVQQAFFNTLGANDTCGFFRIAMDEIKKNLEFFWKNLPYRIEEYEKMNRPDKNYEKLKRDYLFVSLRAWFISKGYYSRCNSDFIPLLYLYSVNCSGCVLEGQNLDTVKYNMGKKGNSIIVFTVDSDQRESSLSMLKKYYKINSTPAIILPDGSVLQGRVFSYDEIIKLLEKEKNEKAK